MNSELRTQNSELRTMNHIFVLNSAIPLTEDLAAQIKPPTIMVRIAPASGEKQARTADGTILMQRFSPESNAAVVLNFAPEVLVDREHESELGGDTTAQAWINKLEAREDGLYAAMNFTDVGWENVRNRRLRFPSGVFFLDPQGYPFALKSCALTNKANLKQLGPVLNTDMAAASGRTPEGRATASGRASQQEGEQMPKELLAMLGLAEDADAPAILEALKALVAQRDALAAKVKESETAALNKEADDFVTANAAKIKDPAKIKAQYVLNKDLTVALFAGVADAPVPTHQVLHRADAKPPAVMNTEADAVRASQRNALVDRISRERGCSHVTAISFARNEKPELF